MIKIILEVKINRQVIPGRKIQMKILYRKKKAETEFQENEIKKENGSAVEMQDI